MDPNPYSLWHRRFVHLGAEKIRNLHKVTTVKKIHVSNEDKDYVCEVCQLSNLRNRAGRVTERNPQVLGLVSLDICGPLDKSRLGYRYFLKIVDNFSRKPWVYPLRNRTDAVAALIQWRKDVTLEVQTELKAARADNAGELVKQLEAWHKEFGLSVELTEPYKSLMNGVAERHIQSSENGMRALLKDSDMPNEFWPEALETDAYIRGRTDTGPAIDGHVVSPEEAYSGSTPSIDHVRVWGCKVYTYMNPKSLPVDSRKDKLMDRSRVGVFVGYVPKTTKMYKIWMPDRKAVVQVAATNVRFDEHAKGGDIDLGIPILSKPNAAPVRNPVGRPVKPTDTDNWYREGTSVPPGKIQRKIAYVQLPIASTLRPPSGGATNSQPINQPIGCSDTPPDRPRKPREVVDQLISQADEEPDEQDDEPDTSRKPRDQSAEVPPTQSEANSTQTRKRARSVDSTSDDDEPKVKHLRALAAVVEQLLDTGVDEGTLIELGFAAIKERVYIPKTHAEAVNDPDNGERWKEAIEAELSALQAN